METSVREINELQQCLEKRVRERKKEKPASSRGAPSCALHASPRSDSPPQLMHSGASVLHESGAASHGGQRTSALHQEVLRGSARSLSLQPGPSLSHGLWETFFHFIYLGCSDNNRSAPSEPGRPGAALCLRAPPAFCFCLVICRLSVRPSSLKLPSVSVQLLKKSPSGKSLFFQLLV